VGWSWKGDVAVVSSGEPIRVVGVGKNIPLVIPWRGHKNQPGGQDGVGGGVSPFS